MGAAAGHIPHLYENLEFSFKDIFTIIQNIIKGKIPSFEKIDGQNLMISVKDNIIVGARNVTQLRNPIPLPYIVDMFAKHQHVKDAFDDGIHRILTALQDLEPTVLNSIFCNGSKFLNVEIVNRISKNVIDYGDPKIVMNGLCTVADGKILSIDPFSAIELYQEYTPIFFKQQIYPPQLIPIKSFTDFNLMGYRKLLSKFRIVDLNIPLKNLTISKEILEKIILKIGYETILNITSNLAYSQITKDDIQTRLLATVKNASPENTLKIMPHLSKMQFCGGLKNTPAIEGIVFYYNNTPYKITGIFAPINQILGISRYSR